MQMRIIAVAVVLVSMIAVSAGAVETRVTVNVLSKDAKFIGTSMGGALVTIRNADTGELLASGLTEGSTSNTGLLMTDNITRRTVLVDDRSAKFQATVDINEPTLVEIKARGPMAQRQSAASASVTQWLFPGKDVTAGNAVLLEIPGFVVDVLSPPAHQKMDAPANVTLRVNLTMMWGCPLEPGGLWDSDPIDISAQVVKNGVHMADVDLTYAGEPSQFEAKLEALEPGTYVVTVTAFDPRNGNAGLDVTTIVVR